MSRKGIYDALSCSFSESEVTWAGANPFSDGLTFGFEDGSLLFTDEIAGPGKFRQQVSKAGESINGFANLGVNNLAVSTRADVTFLDVGPDRPTAISTFSGGAHGVVATRSGFFVSALGANGLLVVKPERGENQLMRVTEGGNAGLYIYRALALDNSEGLEALVFATRRGGVGVSQFSGYEAVRNVHTITSSGLDIVDVCEVQTGTLAAAAISIDGILLLFHDVLNQTRPVTIQLGGLEGTVYRILSSAGHLFVLTSKAIYVWHGLIEGLLKGNSTKESTPPVVVPKAAVEMNVYRNQLLLIVMAANEVQRIEIETIAQMALKTSNHTERFVRTTLKPTWLEGDVKQSTFLASVG